VGRQWETVHEGLQFGPVPPFEIFYPVA